MASPIEFFFEFSSPYGYLAALQIDAIGERHGREVIWKPFLLGAIFKTTGQSPLLNIPVKGAYAQMDLERTARRMGVPYVTPRPFPFMAVAACRAFYWLADRDQRGARDFALEVYRRAFAEGRDMSGAAAVAETAADLGETKQQVLAALSHPAVKERLRTEVLKAEAQGVFGSPFMIVDAQQFWGNDRLEQLNLWLESGGW